MVTRNAISYFEGTVSHLVITWILMIPLIFYASFGVLWFQSVKNDNLISTNFSSVVAMEDKGVSNLFTFIVIGIVLILIIANSVQVMALLKKNVILALIVIEAFLSCLWSQSVFVSLRQSIFLLISTAFAIYFSMRFTYEKQLKVLQLAGWICVFSSFVFALAFPQYGISHIDTYSCWRGIYAGKNPCGEMTVFFLSVMLFVPVHSFLKKMASAVFVGLSVVLIIKTQSTTSEMAMCFLFLYVAFMWGVKRLNLRSRFIALLAGGAITIGLIVLLLFDYNKILYFIGKDPTLTGRTNIWETARLFATKHLLLGYGYGAFWTGLRGESSQAFLVLRSTNGGSHNGFLEVWLSLGLVGVFAVALIIVRSIYDAYTCLIYKPSYYWRWCVCVVFLVLIYSIDEVSILMANNLTWILYMLVAISLHNGAQQIRSMQTYV